MANGIKTGDPRGFNKGCSSKFHVGSQLQQTPEEGRRTIGRNIVEITIKMKTIVQKSLMIKIIKLRLRNLDEKLLQLKKLLFKKKKENYIGPIEMKIITFYVDLKIITLKTTRKYQLC